MEQKTKIYAQDARQELKITRDFDLPIDLLFKAFVEPELVEQWMGTKVVKLEGKKHGGFTYETSDPQGNKHVFSGVIHELEPDKKITRTFEMENTPFGVQLEFYEFEKLTDNTSRLNMQILFKSVELRDQLMQLPFTKGINMAHDRIQNLFNSQSDKYRKQTNN